MQKREFGMLAGGALLATGAVVASESFRVIKQFEKGVVFTFGKVTGEKNPGLALKVPFVQQIKKVDMRVKVLSLPTQETLTADNVTVSVDGVLEIEITDSTKSLCNVDGVYEAVLKLAQLRIREEVSRAPLDVTLHEKGKINAALIAGTERLKEELKDENSSLQNENNYLKEQIEWFLQ